MKKIEDEAFKKRKSLIIKIDLGDGEIEMEKEGDSEAVSKAASEYIAKKGKKKDGIS